MKMLPLILLPIMLAWSAGKCGAADDALAALRPIIGDLRVPVERREAIQPAESNKPPFENESWTFACGVARPRINYGRYLNRPPDFNGQHPSLVNGDSGIGFGNPSTGDAFANWYVGNTIRVLVDGVDILAQQTVSRVESSSDMRAGYLRFHWDLASSNSLELSFSVPEDGHAIYAQVVLSPGVGANSFAVHLQCFPGGFGPYYKIPSCRFAQTGRLYGEVPPDYSGATLPIVPISAGDGWVFYADKLTSGGSLGLVMLPEEQASGEVQLSSYGQGTLLRYPPGTASCRLAFFAFDSELDNAQRMFSATIGKKTETLRKARFWVDETQMK